MSTQLTVPAGFGAVSSRFASTSAAAIAASEMAGGIQSSFAITSIRGKVFRVKYQGNERNIMREDEPDTVASYVDVVIVRASAAIAKLFYVSGYTEGSNAAPDCFSTNGLTPDPASPKVQCTTCAACPQNVWGSKVTPAGKKGKACADSKRLAIVPAGDLSNSAFGGPMLLRVPAASLKDMKDYAEFCAKELGMPTYAIVTRLSFDADEAFPKLVFKPIRALTDADIDVVEGMRESDHVTRMLSEAVDEVHHEPVGSAAPSVVQPAHAPIDPAPVAANNPVAAPTVKAAIVVQEAPASVDEAMDDAGDTTGIAVPQSLDDELAALLKV